MAKATGLTFSLFDVASAQEVPFGMASVRQSVRRKFYKIIFLKFYDNFSISNQSESLFELVSKSVTHLSYKKAIKVALNACSMK